MPLLTPSEAALIARRVYLLREDKVSESRERGRRFGTEGKFTLDDTSTFKGESGALAWQQVSGFGYVAWGEGEHKNEVLVVARGTAVTVDWLTNLNIGTRLGPAGWPVHAGFMKTWKSFSAVLDPLLRGRHPTHIHCVGHSLGGALAALTADWATSNRVAPVSLYTFGAPRCGDAVFSNALTRRVGAANVYRVYHPADIVPMIPMLPFFHSPLPGHGLRLDSGPAALFSVAAHNMEDSYMAGVAGRSWQGLVGGVGTGAQDGVQVRSFLQAAAQGQGSFLMGSAKLLNMIGRALAWLVRKAAWMMGSVLGGAASAGLTLMDQLAWVLGQGAQISKEVAGHVKALMAAILGFLGRKAAASVDVTQAFVRWLLATLVSTLAAIAHRALALLG